MKKVLLLLSFWLMASTFAMNADNPSKEGPKTYPLYQDISLVSAIKFFYDKNKIVIKAVYPQLITLTENPAVQHFNEHMDTLVNEGIADFKSRIRAMDPALFASASKASRNFLYIDYASISVSQGKQHLLSVRLSFQGNIIGQRLGYHYHRTFNYNLDKDTIIDLADLFLSDSEYLHTISQYTQDILFQKLNNQAMILNGTAPLVQNFANWNIKPNGILFTFEDNQVAPTILGAQTVLIPFAILRNYIAPDSIIAPCGKKNRKRCLQKQLVTGGFIDEVLNSKYSVFDPQLGFG